MQAPEALTRDELESVLQTLPRHTSVGARNRAIIALMYRPGLRVGQVIALECRHYRRGANVISVPDKPGGPARPLPLDAITREALNEWLALRDGVGHASHAPLFSTLVGVRGGRLRDTYIRGLLRSAVQDAGIKKRVTPEGLRRASEASVESSVGPDP